MPQRKVLSAHEIVAKQRCKSARIAVSAAAILAASAGAAWQLHSGVSPATAQSAQRVAATMPERDLQVPPMPRPDFAAPRRNAAVVPTRIEKITIAPDAASLIEGRSTAQAAIDLLAGGKPVGTATAKADGSWAIVVERGLGAGDHRLEVRSRAGAGALEMIADTARISVPHTMSGPLVVSYVTAPEPEPSIGRGPVSEIAAALAIDGAMSPAATPKSGSNTGTAASPARFAQVQAPAAGTADAPLAPVRDWLRRAERDYQGIVVRKLTGADDAVAVPATPEAPPTVLAQTTPAPKTTPPPQPGAAPAPAADGSALDALQNWLRRSNETYQKAIIKRLTEPTTLEGIEAQTKADEAKKAIDAKTGEDTLRKAQEELRAAQAKRDEELKQAEAKKQASDEAAAKEAAAKSASPAPGAAADEAARKQAEDKRIADETIKRQADLKAAEEKRAADAKKAADEAASKSAEAKKAADAAAARKQAEDKRLADEAQKRQAELKAAEDKRAADAKKAADEAAAKSAEAQKSADDAAVRKQAEDKRAADEAAAKSAEAKKAVDDAVARKQAEDKRAADEAAAKSAEAKKAADDAAARKQAEDRRLADEAAKRAADAKKLADEKRLAADAAKRAADEAKRAEDLAREAEVRRQADLKATEDARRKAAALAEAASKVTPPEARGPSAPAAPTASAPKTAASAPAPATKMAAATRVVRNYRPKRRAPIDTSSRSALGAGRGAAAIAGRHAVTSGANGCGLAGRRVTPPGYYVVKAGDTLWDIADLHYDDATRFAVLQRANRRIDPDLIHPCQRIYVPAAKRG